jgi:hypothetical protein
MLLAAIWAIGPEKAAAQTLYGELVGNVRDASEAVVAGAAVTVTNANDTGAGTLRQFLTNAAAPTGAGNLAEYNTLLTAFTGFREDIPDDAGIKNCVIGYKKIIGYAEEKKVNLLAYCLMSNHVHVVFQTPEGNLSKMMQAFQTSYNRRHGRTGRERPREGRSPHG